MSTGFDGILFSVYPDGEGFLPAPSPAGNANSPRIYTATLRMTDGSDVAALRNKRSIVTIVPSMGFVRGGTLVVEAGIGSRVLVYPNINGNEITVDAILTDFSDIVSMISNERKVDVSFILVESS